MENLEEKSKAIGTILGLILGYSISFLLAWIFDIQATHEYGWFLGWCHGSWFIPNWIMSLFNDAVLTKAPLHTSAYNIFWWIGLILTCWYTFTNIISTIISIRKLTK